MKLYEIAPSKTEESAIVTFVKAVLEPKFGKVRISNTENHGRTNKHTDWALEFSISKADVSPRAVQSALTNAQDGAIPYQNLVDNMPPLADYMSVFVDSMDDDSLDKLAGDNDELKAKIAARRGTRFVAQLMFRLQ